MNNNIWSKLTGEVIEGTTYYRFNEYPDIVISASQYHNVYLTVYQDRQYMGNVHQALYDMLVVMFVVPDPFINLMEAWD